jgi:DNA-binding XRE family transcriptional regulator
MADRVLQFRSPNPVPTRPPEPEPLWRQAVGEQLRVERTRLGERIADVAERAGVAPQYLSELERGRKDPSSEVLSAVSGALGLPVHEFTRRAGLRLGAAVISVAGNRPSGPVCLAA